MKTEKPLGSRAYGSIPHLPDSKLGPGDHHCEIGQARIATERARDRHDLIIVQEKLDGSNCAVAKINGKIIALTRAGYEAYTSPFIQHHLFDKWVYKNEIRFDKILNDGERIIGEWLVQAHGTRYDLPHEPFVVFDIMIKNKRIRYEDFMNRVLRKFVTPRLLHVGEPVSVEWVLSRLEPSGHGALDLVEGAIWRVERKGEIDFLVKYKRHESQDGRYLPELSGGEAYWNKFKDCII